MSAERSAFLCLLIGLMPNAVQTINAATSPQLVHDLWREMRIAAALMVLQAVPEYSTILDDYSNTLLHVACRLGDRPAVIQRLLDLWPPAAAACNRYQETPLHLACLWSRAESDAVVRLLLSACPETTKQRDQMDRLPLHYVLHSPFSVDVLLELYPQSVTEKVGCNGNNSLHWVCHMGCNVPGVQKLLDVRPQAALTPDREGRLPIHIACESAPHLIALLVQAYPKTLTFADGDGRTPLHFVVRSGDRTLALVQRLVGANPAMVARPDKSGNLPLYYACEPTSELTSDPIDVHALSVIYTLLRATPLQVWLRHHTRDLVVAESTQRKRARFRR